jgi:transposase
MRSMKPKTYVGLDVHRKLVVATAVDPLGKPIRQGSFGPSPNELRKFLSRLPKPTKVVIEACATWERYYEAAASAGAEVVLSHPLKTRLIADASIKTDKADSEALARLLRLDSIPSTYIPSPEIRALRRLYREHEFYSRIKTSTMRRAYSRLADVGVDYSKGGLQHRPQRTQYRERHIVEVDRAIDVMEDLERHCKRIDEQIHLAFVGSVEAQLLQTIPGIGELTAVALVGFLCPIERFPNAEKLSSYVGLCPTTHQSAGTLFHGKLKHDCNRSLRSLVVAASWTNRVHEPAGEVARYTRRIIRRKGKMRGTVAGAHKLLRIVYAILKQRRPYLPHALESSASGQWLRVPLARVSARQSMRRYSLGPSKLRTHGVRSRGSQAAVKPRATKRSRGKDSSAAARTSLRPRGARLRANAAGRVKARRRLQ